MFVFNILPCAVLASVVLGSQDIDLSERTLNRGVVEQYSFSGQPRWQVSELLTSRTVSINCTEEVRPGSSFERMQLRVFTIMLHQPPFATCSFRCTQGVQRTR